jgi:hypothetical protein
MTLEHMAEFKFIAEGIAFLTLSIGATVVLIILSVGMYKMMKGN